MYIDIWDYQMDKKAFKNTVLLIIELSGPNGIGAVKLNKSLLVCDAMYYALHKESFTNASYVKDHFGPVPDNNAMNIIDKMINEGDIIVTEKKYGNKKIEKNHVLAPGVKVPRDDFSDDDIERISHIVKEVMKMSANELSNTTHDREYHKTYKNDLIDLNEIFEWRVLDNFMYSEDDDNKLEEILRNNLNDISSIVHTT